jgi:hypothetical protein
MRGNGVSTTSTEHANRMRWKATLMVVVSVPATVLSGSFLSHGLALQYDRTHPDSPGLTQYDRKLTSTNSQFTPLLIQESSRSSSSPRRSRDRLDAVINNNGRSPAGHAAHMMAKRKADGDGDTLLPH